MLELLVVLSVLEGLLLIGALVVYLILIDQRLRGATTYMAKIAFGVRAIETQTGRIGASIRRINAALTRRLEPAQPPARPARAADRRR